MPRRSIRVLLAWLSLAALVALGLAQWGRRGLTLAQTRRDERPDAPVDGPPDREIAMPAEVVRLLRSWLVLLLLGGIEFGASFLPISRTLRPLVMIPAVLMVAIVAVSFMEVGKGPAIVRGFAVAAMFWLLVLLGLGSLDPLTRTDYSAPHAYGER